MPDPVTAVTTVSLLITFLTGAVQRAGEQSGEAAQGAIRALFGHVRDRFRGDDYAARALQRLEENPDNERRQAAVVDILAEKLEEDPGFADEVRKLLDDVREAGGPISIQDGGAVAINGDVIINADRAAGRDQTNIG